MTAIALFTVNFFTFALQCNPMWMHGNFGIKLQNSPKLPHMHGGFYCKENDNLQQSKWMEIDLVSRNIFFCHLSLISSTNRLAISL